MKTIKVVIPMAGSGSRFSSFKMPKPLIPTNEAGEPMWRTSAECLRLPGCEFIFVIQKAHRRMERELSQWNGGSRVCFVPELTDGPLSTVLATSDFLDGSPLIIANCDQYVDWAKSEFASFVSLVCSTDGAIVTMNVDDADPKWSYVKSYDHQVELVAEKRVISKEATLGIYGFASGIEFMHNAQRMIEHDMRVNGEFYVCPVYNEMVIRGMVVQTFNLGERGIRWCGLGTPEDLERYKIGGWRNG